MEYVFRNIQTATAIQCEHLEIIRKKFEDTIIKQLQGTINIEDLGFDKIQEKTKLKYTVVRSIEVSFINQIEQQEYVILELIN